MKSGKGITISTAQRIRKGKGLPETPMLKARLAAGMSQDDLAKASGLSPSTIRNYEQGKRDSDGNLEALCRIAIALNCPVASLIKSDTLKDLFNKATLTS